MKNILIIGATGNIGKEVIRYLFQNNTSNRIYAAVRDREKAEIKFIGFPELEYRQFDFENDNQQDAFTAIDIVFLLRPPHISDVFKYFTPLLEAAKDSGVNKIVFLSVQGVEKSKIIPHHKIEKLIKDLNFSFIFIRPSYFMQNLTTSLLPDIKNNNEIILPAGKAKFNWVDVNNVSESCAIVLEDFDRYKDLSYEITGNDLTNFEDVSSMISTEIQRKISYKNVNPFSFYYLKKKEGMANGLIMVMIMLHFLPRFQKPAKITKCYQELSHKMPTTLQDFIKREKSHFT